jgi:zinc protease
LNDVRSAVDRSAPPQPGPVSAFSFPAYRRARLGNGLTVLAARATRGPVVQTAFLFPAGAERDPRGGAGTATLVGSLTDEGTAGRSALDIAAAVENVGGRLSTGADWDVGYLDLQVLTRHAGEALRLLTELATASTLPEEELERQRRRRLADLLRKKSDPSFLASERFAQVVYAGTPYGHSLVGDEASVAGLRRDDLLRFYRGGYALAGAYLLAVGDLDPEAFLAEAEAVLGDLPGGSPEPRPDFEPPAIEGVRGEIVDRSHAAQTELRVGHAGVPRSHPDYLPLSVLNAILGGKFTSRINLNLRERHGYTYGAHSSFAGRRGPGPFLVRTAVATEVAGAAVREVLGELSRIGEETVTAEELDDAKSYLVGTFPYTLQTVSGLLDRLETLALHELPGDYYDRLPEALQAVTAQDVLRVARAHLRPRDLVVVAVGPEDELRRQLDAEGVYSSRATSAAPGS